jgi:hypothetical protein
VIKFLIRCLPDSILDAVNTESLAELDRRKLIVWAEDMPVMKPESENSAYDLASRFLKVTPENILEVFKVIAQMYTDYGNCLAFTYLMEIPAEYFGLISDVDNV